MKLAKCEWATWRFNLHWQSRNLLTDCDRSPALVCCLKWALVYPCLCVCTCVRACTPAGWTLKLLSCDTPSDSHTRTRVSLISCFHQWAEPLNIQTRTRSQSQAHKKSRTSVHADCHLIISIFWEWRKNKPRIQPLLWDFPPLSPLCSVTSRGLRQNSHTHSCHTVDGH